MRPALCDDQPMPKIDAPTVAEHRDQRRAALLAAGQDLVITGGPSAVTMTAVAARAGLSRTAVYEYFASTQDLLAAVLGERMAAWTVEVDEALQNVDDPESKLTIYVQVSLGLITDGSHTLLALLSAEIAAVTAFAIAGVKSLAAAD